MKILSWHIETRRIIRIVGFLPVIFCLGLIGWSYYAFVVELCIRALFPIHPTQAAVYIALYHPLLVLFVWSYLAVVFTHPGSARTLNVTANEMDLEAGMGSVSEHIHEERDETERRTSQDGEERTTESSPLQYQEGNGAHPAIRPEWSNPPPLPPLLPLTLPSTSLMVKRDGKSVRYCRKCRCVKPDRAHHCRVCQEYDLVAEVVFDLVSHCPWINGCVGHHNQKHFFLFIFYGALYTTYIFACLAPVLYGLFSGGSNVVAEINVHWIFLSVASLIFFPTLIGFTSFHTYLIVCNTTTIENFQRNRYDSTVHGLQKKSENVFDLGWKRNIAQVFGDRILRGCFPVGTCPGDGVTWDVKEGVKRLIPGASQDMEAEAMVVEDDTRPPPIRGRLGYDPV